MANPPRQPVRGGRMADEATQAIRTDIFWLHTHKRYSYRGVAASLGYSPETIRQWMRDEKRPKDPAGVLAKLRLLKNSP